jgi:hypothetical protein
MKDETKDAVTYVRQHGFDTPRSTDKCVAEGAGHWAIFTIEAGENIGPGW